jgi:formylglycine-generating enzyme required for sulfatase activity
MDAIDHPLAGQPPPAGMVWIPAGTYRVGSDRHYKEEAPSHDATLPGFFIEIFAVTNAEFAAFAAATGYVTVAERPLNPASYPGVDPALLRPGALVFHMTDGPVNLRDPGQWWSYVPGACWSHPEGPGSHLAGRDDHPVVQIAFEDAAAYAEWRGRALPTEAEWEVAARGGLPAASYVWGDEFTQEGRHMANTWQGSFPYENLREDGRTGTTPVGSYPPNGYGLYDMAGNVWEWTADWYAAGHAPDKPSPCCTPASPIEASYDALQPEIRIPRKVIKGGSFLCAPSYCRRYRPAARQPQMVDTATNHIGFRCVLR